MDEYKLSITNMQQTAALFQHQDHTGHIIILDSARQIENIEDYRERLVGEAVEIEIRGNLNTRNYL